MHSFESLSEQFRQRYLGRHFPQTPTTLYDSAQYILDLGGKHIRPVLCLMGNELFGELCADAFPVALAIELFHNFTLIHDDIMDRAPLRRGHPTVHTRWNEPTALLAGDVMLVRAYEYLGQVHRNQLPDILKTFNQAARGVCEGQQLDMEFEGLDLGSIRLDAYLDMITLKTSVLLAASLKLGAILGGGSQANASYLYEFGKNLGIAYQIQDDWLDAFGDPGKFGKQPGGDIMANKKTFLLVQAFQTSDALLRTQILELIGSCPPEKVGLMLDLFRETGVSEWARKEKSRYAELALANLEKIAVISPRKQALKDLVYELLDRQQ